ncbi:MAG: transposase [Muribaculaceae bacterium]|nr:transposase [Muribaculaceae bacterium]
MKRLQIIDSTTITLFSNLLIKGIGRHLKTGKKKGGIKVHAVIHANEGVPSDIKFTSAATTDSFMLKPSTMNKGDILAMDRAYIDYEKFQQLTERGVIYVTKLKKNLKYFYGESANAIKIQIWVTLIANLLLMVMQKGLKRQWSFSELATMVRITLMYYVDFYSLFNNPEKEWEIILSEAFKTPPIPSLFDQWGLEIKKTDSNTVISAFEPCVCDIFKFYRTAILFYKNFS